MTSFLYQFHNKFDIRSKLCLILKRKPTLITDSFSEEEDEFIMAEENNHAADDDIDQEDIRNLHIDGKDFWAFLD